MFRCKHLIACLLCVLLVCCGCSFVDPLGAESSASFAESLVSSFTSSEENSFYQEESSFYEESSSVPPQEIPLPEDESSEESDIEIPVIPEDTVINFVACGDNLIHPSVYYAGMEYYAAANGTVVDYDQKATNDSNYDFLPIYEYVADTMKNADICFVNQETSPEAPVPRLTDIPSSTLPWQWQEIWLPWAWTLSTWPTTICWTPAVTAC